MIAKHTLRDALTMLRRDATHALRNPMLSLSAIFTPTIMLLLFDGVFGGAMSHSLLSGAAAAPYIDYLTPGIILMAVGSSVSGTAISISIDQREGIIARFRTMAISRTSVLTGAVIGAVIRTLLATLVVFAVALLLGFRSSGGPLQWLAALGMVALLALALTWLAVAFGLATKSAAGANSLGLIPSFLPFISSAFVPTDSMPAGVRWFAENQPYTPMIETLRGLLMGTPVGSRWILAAAWCAVIGLAGYLWARHLYNRDPSRQAGPSVAQLMGQ
jgi:ABC-2 type transport system permease protein